MRGQLAMKLHACRLRATKHALTLIWSFVIKIGAQALVVKEPKVHCTTGGCHRGTRST